MMFVRFKTYSILETTKMDFVILLVKMDHCCRSGIEDGLPLGVKLGIDEGSEDGFEEGSSEGIEDGSSLGVKLRIDQQRVRRLLQKRHRRWLVPWCRAQYRQGF
jgi:hypothetical protein